MQIMRIERRVNLHLLSVVRYPSVPFLSVSCQLVVQGEQTYLVEVLQSRPDQTRPDQTRRRLRTRFCARRWNKVQSTRLLSLSLSLSVSLASPTPPAFRFYRFYFIVTRHTDARRARSSFPSHSFSPGHRVVDRLIGRNWKPARQ